MKKKLNIGILGSANVAKKYAIRAFKSLSAVGNVYVSSRDVNKSKLVANEFGIDSKESYKSIIDDKDIDAVYIPLPIGLHEEWAIKAASAKKHVICEKSLSGNFASAKKMIECCRSNNVVLFEDFMCEYHPQHEKVLSLVSKGEIGKLFAFRGYFGFPPLDRGNFRYSKELGGGSLNDAGAYPVFMARKILNSEPVAVTCNLVMEHGIDVKGAAYMEFPNNILAFVAFGFDNAYQNNYSLWGSKGVVTVKRAYSIPPDMKPSIEIYKNDGSKDIFTEIETPAANHFELIFDNFLQTILKNNDKKRNERYMQMLNQAKVLEAMRISAREDRKVKLWEIR